MSKESARATQGPLMADVCEADWKSWSPSDSFTEALRGPSVLTLGHLTTELVCWVAQQVSTKCLTAAGVHSVLCWRPQVQSKMSSVQDTLQRLLGVGLLPVSASLWQLLASSLLPTSPVLRLKLSLYLLKTHTQ